MSKEACCEKINENKAHLTTTFQKRTDAVSAVLAKLHAHIQAIVSAMPTLSNTTDSQVAFANYFTNEGVLPKIEKAAREHSKVKNAVTKLGMVDGAQAASRTEQLLERGRGHLCAFAALTLLSNPKLHVKGKGEALRKQLTSTKAVMDSKREAYGESLPDWLVDRVDIALGIAISPVGGAAGEALAAAVAAAPE